jgi:hypothetical protein
MRNLFGRAYDSLRNSAGKLFHAEFIMYIFEEAQRRDLGIRAFQVIQEDLRTLRIRLVPGPHYTRSTEDFIAHHLRDNFDRDVAITFERVDQIGRALSGKMRLVIGMDNPGEP